MDPGWAALILVVGLVTAINLVLLMVLIRQYGLVVGRLGPAGARMSEEGPEPGEKLDLSALAAVTASPVFERDSGRPLLLYFLDPGCRTCKEVLSMVPIVARTERWLDQAVISLREPEGGLLTWKDLIPSTVPVGIGPTVAAGWNIYGGPFALAVDAQRQVRAKGIVNTKEDLDSLISVLDSMLQHRTHEERVAREARDATVQP